MIRISGINLPDNKTIEIALTSIYGIGRVSARNILDRVGIPYGKRVHELTTDEAARIRSVIDADYETEGELRQRVFQNIKRLKDIRCYRGLRHKAGLPVRGQRTRTNAYTRKGHNIAVGGLKRTLEKT